MGNPGQYEHSLLAMKRLLDVVGEAHWADWIQTDIEQWRSERSTSHHLSAYGGMGSFNDIFICRTNQHKITKAQEPWANTLFKWLKSLCYYLAKHPKGAVAAETLSRVVGRYDSVLAAFVGGHAAPNSMKGYVNENQELHGWRCRCCGRSEVSNGDIEQLIAQDVVPQLVFQSCESLSLDKLVDQVLACDIADIRNIRQTLVRAVVASGITLEDRDCWRQPCPNCGKEDAAVHRWRMTVRDGVSFQPSDNSDATINLVLSIGKRIGRRLAGRATGRWLSRLFRR